MQPDPRGVSYLVVPDRVEARCPECQQAVNGAEWFYAYNAETREIVWKTAVLAFCGCQFSWPPDEPGPQLVFFGGSGAPTGENFQFA